MRCVRILAVVASILGASADGRAQPATELALKELNRTPDRFLGRRISVAARITGEVATVGPRHELTVMIDPATRARSLRFELPKAIAAQMKVQPAGELLRVLIVGTVVAPDSPNAPYPIDVEEIRVTAADGTVTATYLPTTPVPKSEAILTPAAVAPVPALVEPATADAPAAQEWILPFAISVAVGLLCAVGWFLLRRRSPAPAVKAKRPLAPRASDELVPLPPLERDDDDGPKPTRSVQDRLNRRVR